MKLLYKTALFFLLAFILINCSHSKNAIKKDRIRSIVVEQKLDSININSKNKIYDLVERSVLIENDTVYTHELKLFNVRSAMHSKKLMYDKYGEWNKFVHLEKDRHPVLIWDRVKLFDDSQTLYTVVCDGDESRKEMYSSVVVYDKSVDCINPSNKDSKKIIAFFVEEIRNLEKTTKFYKAYWKLVYNFDAKNKS